MASSAMARKHPTQNTDIKSPTKRNQNYMNANQAAGSQMSNHRDQSHLSQQPQLIKTSEVHRSTLI